MIKKATYTEPNTTHDRSAEATKASPAAKNVAKSASKKNVRTPARRGTPPLSRLELMQATEIVEQPWDYVDDESFTKKNAEQLRKAIDDLAEEIGDLHYRLQRTTVSLRAYPDDFGIGVTVESELLSGDGYFFAGDLDQMLIDFKKSSDDLEDKERLKLAREFDDIAKTAARMATLIRDSIPRSIVDADAAEYQAWLAS